MSDKTVLEADVIFKFEASLLLLLVLSFFFLNLWLRIFLIMFEVDNLFNFILGLGLGLGLGLSLDDRGRDARIGFLLEEFWSRLISLLLLVVKVVCFGFSFSLSK